MVATGAIAGTLAGLLGIGGGIIIVPVLAIVFQHQGVATDVVMHVSIGTSLATIVFTSLSSIRAHHRVGAVRWPIVRAIAPGIVIGGFAGAGIAKLLPGHFLQSAFAIFMLVVVAQMTFSKPPAPHRVLPGRIGLFTAGSSIGAVSSIMGVGGASMMVPFLTWCNVSVRNAVATSAAIGFPIAVSGTVGFIITGWGVAARPNWSLGYINGPAFLGIVLASASFAPLGAKLAHSIPEQLLKRGFAVFLAVLAVRMLLG